MNIFIATFTKDEASMTERASLLNLEFEEVEMEFDNYPVQKYSEEETNSIYLINTDKDCVTYENLDKAIEEQAGIKPDLLIFATKHQSKSGIHSLSCHTQGNWAKAEYGGKDREVAICPATLLCETYLKLKEINSERELGYEVILECTHHGPSVNTPSMFIEIGSDLESWQRRDAGEAIADTLLEVLPDYSLEKTKDIPIAIGIGGLHHAPGFSKLYDANKAYVGHVCPKYMLEQLTEETLKQAIARHVPECELILLDWKGMTDKERLMPIIEKVSNELDIPVKKTKQI